MSKERRERYRGRGTVGKIPIAGLYDRATGRVSAAVVEDTSKRTLQRFVCDHIKPNVVAIFTDELASYLGLPRHKSVNHSAYEFVRGDVHTNSMESFGPRSKGLIKECITGGAVGTYNVMWTSSADASTCAS